MREDQDVRCPEPDTEPKPGFRGEMGRGAHLLAPHNLPQGPTHTISLYSPTPGAPVAGAGGLLLPQPHLLMQIVVKQDQIEVQLQAPQRPLLDSMLATTFLGTGREMEKRGC